MANKEAAGMRESLDRLRNRLIVSVQASPGEPLCAPDHIKALSLSALQGGAGGLRLEGAGNIAFVRSCTTAPIIGLIKSPSIPPEQRIDRAYITAGFAEAKQIAGAGADIVAVDGTGRPRADGISLSDLIERIHKELHKPVWADVSTLKEGMAAADAGADLVSTTLSGYTRDTLAPPETAPDLPLLQALCSRVSIPVVLEGRVWLAEDVKRAFAQGAFAVVVGSAITRPQLITARFVASCPREDNC